MAAVVAFVVPPLFIATLVVVGTYRGDGQPGVGVSDAAFIRFYVDNFSKIPLTSTMSTIGWALILIVLVALVRALAPRTTLPGILAITFAGAATAVSVAAQGLFTYPTLVPALTAEDLRANLDPATARFLVLSTEAVQNVGGILFGIALLMVALVAAGSSARGHRIIAAMAAIMGAAGTFNLVLGGGGSAAIGMIPFGVVSGIVVLIARSRPHQPHA